MGSLSLSLQKLKKLEFGSIDKCLHKNPTEEEYTYWGIYKKAHPTWEGWDIVCKVVNESSSLVSASRKLYKDEKLTDMVFKFYRDNFWDKLKLDLVVSQHKCDEIFCFSVHVGARQATLLVQNIMCITQDGIVGPITIREINKMPETLFDDMFDDYEKGYYDRLIQNFPKFEPYRKGWHKRAEEI